ncbi:MAG: hypothetical protein JJU27_05790 [Gammaproteobacteria bacterium]|nr:hypothetical protein [Gammaproteobacteria bacterium]
MSARQAQLQQLAAALIAARRGWRSIGHDRAVLPRDLAEAYAVAARVAADSAPHCGWKVGATSKRAWQMLGLQAPFFGRISERWVCQSGAVIGCRAGTLSLEAEIGAVLDEAALEKLAAGVPAAMALSQIFPVIEINRPDFAEPFAAGGLCLIADNGVNRGLILPAHDTLWSAQQAQRAVVDVTMNGEVAARGEATQVLDGQPLSAVDWLYRTLPEFGLALQPGDLVATGAMMPPLEVRPGDQVVFEFQEGARMAVDITANEAA